MGDVVAFPSGEAVVTGKKCKTCGFVMVMTKSDPARDECFCCAHTIPLHCLDCGGSGVVDTFARVDNGSSPKREPCMGCLGTGRRG